jgi:hypothetical protein
VSMMSRDITRTCSTRRPSRTTSTRISLTT